MAEPDRLQIEIELPTDPMCTPDVASNILRKIARAIEEGETDGPVSDVNGQPIGFYRTVC